VEVYLRAFLVSALDGGEWLASRPSRFNPRGNRPQYTLDRSLGGSQSRGLGAVTRTKISINDPSGNWSPVVQPVALSVH